MIIKGTSIRISATIKQDGAILDLSGVSALVLTVIRPDTSSEDLALSVDNAILGTCHVDIPSADVDQAGTWKAYPKCTLSGGGTYIAPAKKFEIHSEGTVG